MKKIAFLLAFAALAMTAAAQPWGPHPETHPVWPDGAPNAFEYDAATDPHGENYKEAILEIYPARNPNGNCVIICPGGGHGFGWGIITYIRRSGVRNLKNGFLLWLSNNNLPPVESLRQAAFCSFNIYV